MRTLIAQVSCFGHVRRLYLFKELPDPKAQSVASPIADSEVRSLILVLPDTCTFVETDYDFLLPLIQERLLAFVSKSMCNEVLVNR